MVQTLNTTFSEENPRFLKQQISLTILAAMFFFVWALYNTLFKPYGFDMGCISFPCVIIAGFALLCNLRSRRISPIATYSFLIAGSLVTLNYSLGTFSALKGGGGGEGPDEHDETYLIRYAIYCGIFAVAWGVYTIYLFTNLQKYRVRNGSGSAEYTRIDSVA